MATHQGEEVITFSLSVLDFYKTDTSFTNLFKLNLQKDNASNEDEEDEEDSNEGGDDVNMATTVSKGEKYPIAIKVLPVDSGYSDFVINPSETYVEVQSNTGRSLEVYGEMSVDSTNQTVLFSWDTSKYSLGSYTIVFWISITYNETSFLMRSETISKSIRKSSLIDV